MAPVTDAYLDIPDSRDLIYRPSLATLRAEVDPRKEENCWWEGGRVRDQGREASCTGHALAAAIDHLLAVEGVDGSVGREKPTLGELREPYASARMLYGNAQLHDEWNGEGYSGSSLRGAIKGFHHNGVCSIGTARKVLGEKFDLDAIKKGSQRWWWHTNAAITNEARHAVLGAYYRVRPQLTDMHCAISESRVLVVTARIHDGWHKPDGNNAIAFDPLNQKGSKKPKYHAFVVIGYTKQGFLVQNSWGDKWGEGGVAVWSYEDWSRNVADVWALRLAAPLPNAFRYSVGLQGVSGVAGEGERAMRAAPTRLDVLGHLLPIVDGRMLRHGPFHHDPATIAETIRIIHDRLSDEEVEKARQAGKSDPRFAKKRTAHKLPAKDLKYNHVLIHVLAGGRGSEAAARYVRAIHPVYRENGIYPIFLLWEPDLYDELHRQVAKVIEKIATRSHPGGPQRDKMIARLVEIEAAGLAGRLRRELERSVRRFFYVMVPDPETTPEDLPREIRTRNADGISTMDRLFGYLEDRHQAGTLSYHLVGHDLGARFIAELLSARADEGASHIPVFSTLNLVSPMIERRRFVDQVVPALAGSGEGSVNRKSKRSEAIVEKTTLWCLDEDAAKLDRFDPGYPLNWPTFWARVLGVMINREMTIIDRRDEDADKKSGKGAYETVKKSFEEIEIVDDFPVMKSLALADYAEKAVKEAKKRGARIHLQKVSVTGTDGLAGHATLDGSHMIVNAILTDILGEEGVKRPFSELDWQLSR